MHLSRTMMIVCRLRLHNSRRKNWRHKTATYFGPRWLEHAVRVRGNGEGGTLWHAKVHFYSLCGESEGNNTTTEAILGSAVEDVDTASASEMTG